MRTIRTISAIGLLIAIISCSTNRLPNIEAIDHTSFAKSKQSSKAPQEVLAQAEKDIQKGSMENLAYYAPIHMSLAEKYLKNAHELFVKEGDPVTIMAEGFKAQKMITEGLLTKQSVIRQLKDIFEMKNRLDMLNTHVHFHDEYEDQIETIAKLIKYIEKGEQEALENKRKDCLSEMLSLEIDVVKKITLSEAKQMLKQAKNIDAKKHAPKSWKTAVDTLDQSTVFIESFPRNDDGVQKAGAEALKASQHAYYVTQAVLKIKETDEDELESIVLDTENKLNRIALGLGVGDIRYMSLHDQSVMLAQKAEKLNNTLAFLKNSREETPVKIVSSENKPVSIERSHTTETVPKEMENSSVSNGNDTPDNAITEGKTEKDTTVLTTSAVPPSTLSETAGGEVLAEETGAVETTPLEHPATDVMAKTTPPERSRSLDDEPAITEGNPDGIKTEDNTDAHPADSGAVATLEVETLAKENEKSDVSTPHTESMESANKGSTDKNLVIEANDDRTEVNE